MINQVRRCVVSAITIAAVTISGAAVAQESGEQIAPPTGPPEQMKEIAFLVGTWDVAMSMIINPTKPDEWTDEPGEVTYYYVAGGSALAIDYTSSFMGMDFHGFGLQAYDREKKEWQMTWTDNFAARIIIYTGQRANGETVVTGMELTGGKAVPSRITTFNETPTKFEWKIEQSFDDGKTWKVFAKAVYTKRK